MYIFISISIQIVVYIPIKLSINIHKIMTGCNNNSSSAACQLCLEITHLNKYRNSFIIFSGAVQN